MLFNSLVVLHVIVSLVLVFIVLLQGGRGAELGAAFGGVGQAQGGRTPLSGIGRVTAIAALIFMLTSLSLAYLSSENASDSVFNDFQPTVNVQESETPVASESHTEAAPQLEQTDAPPMPGETTTAE